MALDPEANELACDMYRQQIERVVKNPQTAEGLMPRDYPMGCKRPVIDTNYYETFNRDNVTLVDLRRGGIETITATGVQTARGISNSILWFTRQDSYRDSALQKIDIRGRDSEQHAIIGSRPAYLFGLASKWLP